MTSYTMRSVFAGTAIALLAAPSLAQQPAAAPPAAPAAGAAQAGPPRTIFAGICVYASSVAMTRSKVGAYVLQRLDQITRQVNAEIDGQRNQLQTDVQALNTQVQSAAIQQPQAEQQALALRQREQALLNLMQIRQREVDITEQKAFERVSNEIRPLMEQSFHEKACTVLFEQQAAVLYAQNYDITADVITKLDAKLQEFPFERERVDPQTGAPVGVQPSGAPTAAGRAGAPAAGRSGPPAPAPARGGRGN